MILDGHIHIFEEKGDSKKLLDDMKQAGVDGGILISIPPDWFGAETEGMSSEARLDSLMGWTAGSDNLYPFYWIDPMEDDKLDQIDMAVERGVKGFKIICHDYLPWEDECVDTLTAIAEAGKPVLFHSGIVWANAWSEYSRPVHFEQLFAIDNLRFSMAHISWPWYDEMIAVYGKWQWEKRTGRTKAELFIDLTPGTPPMYRRDALTKLYTLGYDVKNNVFFGTDSLTAPYNIDCTKEWIDRDNAIYHDLGLDEEMIKGIYSKNLLRFIEG